MSEPTLHPTHDNVRALFARKIPGKVVMLNLLKFRETADYSSCPELAPATSISGREAYRLYVEAVEPILKNMGGRLLFVGDGGGFLIGPSDEQWDQVLLVEHQSPEVFLGFAKDESYLAVGGHRTAALEDSRLLPLVGALTAPA